MSQNNQQETLVVNTTQQLLSAPTIWFMLTNLCNINCHYCFNYVSKNHEHMSPELALAILKHYLNYQQAHGIKHDYINVHFFGGEPTLNPEALFAVMDYLNEQKIKCFPLLATNGIIKEDMLDKVIERKMAFRLSFDGLKNSLRFTKSGKGDINPTIIQTIKKVRAAGQLIQMRATVHAGNVNNMCQVVNFAAEHDLDDLTFFPVYLDGNAKIYPVKQPAIEDYVNNFIKARELAKKLNISIKGEQNALFKGKESSIFHYQLFWLPDGSLSPSIQFPSSRSEEAKNAMIGRFNLEKNDIEIDQDKIVQLGNNFYANREKYCAGCEFKNTCQGAIRFDSYMLNDKVKSADNYFCDTAKKLSQYQ